MRAEREKTFTLSSSLSLHTVDARDERYLLVVSSRRYCDFYLSFRWYDYYKLNLAVYAIFPQQ